MCFCKDTMKRVKNQIYLSFSEREYLRRQSNGVLVRYLVRYLFDSLFGYGLKGQSCCYRNVLSRALFLYYFFYHFNTFLNLAEFFFFTRE
jgi:hypothetical protein